MIIRKFWLGLVLALLCQNPLLSAAPAGTRDWEKSVVNLEVTRKQYDYFLPWTKQVQSIVKSGVVTAPNEILTTADALEDHTLIRVQKGGRGQWWNAEAKWIDYPANLAIITVKEEKFWNGLKAASLAEKPARDGDIRIVRWREGNLEARKAEFGRFTVGTSEKSDAMRVEMELSSEIEAVGMSEPVVVGGKVIGLVFADSERVCQALPSSFIRSILEARRKGDYKGLGYFDFTWQPAENPATLEFLKLKGEPRGVITIDAPKRQGIPSELKEHDIILQIDGFPIDIQGDYLDPQYGYLMLENLATRNKWAGDSVRLKVWREGKEHDISYRLPKAEDAAKLVPEAEFDAEPEYLIAGGLVFQPLSRNYLRRWGADWKRQAPFRLTYFRNQDPTPDQPAIIVLSQVLPDVFNQGYQEARTLVLERVNGKRVSYLPELASALKEPKDGFHVLEFQQGETWQRIVLDAENLKSATERVLQRYGIASDRFFSGTTP